VNMKRYALVAAVFLAAILTGIMDAGAVWHVGASNSTKIDVDSNNPPNGNGDDRFKKTWVILNGVQSAVSFSYTACCTQAAAWCPAGQNIGVSAVVTVSITTPNGVATVTLPQEACCTPCCPVNVSAYESITSIGGVQGAAWGGAATSISISALIFCICCDDDNNWLTSSSTSDIVPVGPMNPAN